MRLIDADKLPVTCTIAVIDGNLELKGWIAAERISEAPTIEAIPVEWIENWLNSFYRWINGTKYYMGDGFDSAATMLDEWRKKKNEQVNSKN